MRVHAEFPLDYNAFLTVLVQPYNLSHTVPGWTLLYRWASFSASLNVNELTGVMTHDLGKSSSGQKFFILRGSFQRELQDLARLYAVD